MNDKESGRWLPSASDKDYGYLTFGIWAVMAVILVLLYTLMLQHNFTRESLQMALENNTRRADVIYEYLNLHYSRRDFESFIDSHDMDNANYIAIQKELNQIRTLEEVRYLYTASRNSQGQLVYVIDGLNLDAGDDFRRPGDLIEPEIIPDLERTMAGEVTYSDNIMDTTWGHIFAANYPLYASDGSGEIIGALCMEMDMEQDYQRIQAGSQKVYELAAVTALLIVLLLIPVSVYVRKNRAKEKAYTEQLEESAREAEKANLSKTDFLRRMSHDIRTPINGIKGMLDIADHYPGDWPKQKACHDKIRDSASHLLSLLNNILDMNKLESGSIVLQHRPFHLSRVLQETVSICQIQAVEHDVTFRKNGAEKSVQHWSLLGSETHLQQVLLNFCTNAIKYNKPGGSVTVSVEEFKCEGKTAWYRFICRDTGIGMSEEFQQHAFEVFTQENSQSTRTTYAGSGLGMSIAKQLVDLMGGTVELQSKEGEGTTVIVELPFEIDEHPIILEEEDVEGLRFDGVKVLMAEDNDINAEIASFMLENHGMEVAVAQNGQEAVEMFRASQPGEYGVILMDIMMPVMDGLTAARAIRALDRPDAKLIPIFAMTANAFTDDVQQSHEAGMNEHLTKPIQEIEVLKVLNKYLGK